jgi:hypothetical protein
MIADWLIMLVSVCLTLYSVSRNFSYLERETVRAPSISRWKPKGCDDVECH